MNPKNNKITTTTKSISTMVAKKTHPYNPSIWGPFKILMAR
jgi:hypothetical protein